MSLLTLSISCFKSYSASTQQVINFQGPLTLITGKSGSGKSTIIELLNYVITGSLPTVHSERNLVRDLALAEQQASILAMAKLKFKAFNGRPLFACRMLRIDHHKKVVKKGIIGFKERGEQYDIFYEKKEADMSERLLQLLGFSKTFFDEVVFAHQAQAHPFVAKVKTRFFDIFKLSQLTSIVEGFEQQRKRYEDNLVNLRRSLKRLKKIYYHDKQQKIKYMTQLVRVSEEFVKIAFSQQKMEQNQPNTDQMQPIKLASQAVEHQQIPKSALKSTKNEISNSNLIQAAQTKSKLMQTQTKRESDELKDELKTKKQEMDLNADVAFREYYRPLQVEYLKQKMEFQFKEKAFADINTIVSALYASAEEFLSDKIAKINQVIDEIWKEVYDEGDIAYIKIGIVLGTSHSANCTPKITVFMGQPNSSALLDVFQHASSSQLALASIVVRLALLEVISESARLLVLDEPTIHLTRKQVARLASLISRMVENNSENIQIIIASSDEEFIEKISKHASSHYEVSKDDYLYSNICKKKAEQLRATLAI